MARLFILLILFTLRVDAQTLTMAAEDDYYPYSAEIDGHLIGMVPDLVRASFAAVGKEVKFTVAPYKRVVKMVKTGKVVGGFTGGVDSSNRNSFLWPGAPLSVVHLSIWGPMDSNTSELTATDMGGHRVGITLGYYYPESISANDNVRKISAPSDQSSLRMLGMGRVDYALVTKKIGENITNQTDSGKLRDQIKVIGEIAEIPQFAFFSKKNPDAAEALAAFDRGYEIIRENGSYQSIFDHWFPHSDVATVGQ